MTLRLALAQLDLLVGDVDGNARRVIEAAHYARDAQRADAVLFPELTLTGYPPEDLLLRADFIRCCEQALSRICQAVSGIDVVLGYPRRHDVRLYNAAGLIRGGRVVAEYHKQCLPNYSVFDEKRYFTPGHEPCVFEMKGVPVALTICEDVWEEAPAAQAAAAGARLLLNINASPFYAGKGREREELLARRARDNALAIVYVNLVGGQDELVFDGGSFVVDAEGRLAQRGESFVEARLLAEFDLMPVPRPRPAEVAVPPGDEADIYRALVLGVRDYVDKNGFAGAVLGVSGGIDSALTLAIAVDALGADRVEAVSMPSRHTAPISIEAAMQEARALGVACRVIPIEPAFQAFLGMLAGEFAGLPEDVAEENIQARCRGIVLMAISNKKGRILLTTGNKSEMSVGYTTLYGDMAGGFAPLRDVSKTLVYRLARYRNRVSPVIPRPSLERPPTAELVPGQRDTDALPPYDILDPILLGYVEQDRSAEELVAAGFDEATVRRVVRMVVRNEYKRRQSPPGIKISRRAFGRDRRYPITNGF